MSPAPGPLKISSSSPAWCFKLFLPAPEHMKHISVPCKLMLIQRNPKIWIICIIYHITICTSQVPRPTLLSSMSENLTISICTILIRRRLKAITQSPIMRVVPHFSAFSPSASSKNCTISTF